MKTFFKKQKNTMKEKGFTLLFAVLVSTLIVSISATVISIAVRQTIISGTSRESQYAFYAANTILECATYWDVVGVTSTPNVVFPYTSGLPTGEIRVSGTELDDITCGGGNITNGSGFTAGGFANKAWDISTPNQTTIYLELKDKTNTFTHSYCAQATVTKTKNGAEPVLTTIDARGYNTCDLTSPRAVERGLVQSY